jgi:tripartite-type tricarboxylate transporter receptor subunit TctC
VHASAAPTADGFARRIAAKYSQHAIQYERGTHLGRLKLVHRRKFLQLAAWTAALAASEQKASAQTYPTRPVRMIVPVAAGGLNDVTARLIGQWLTEHLGQQFFIENRPGAGTNLGTEAAVWATADGYTLLIAGSSAAINATVFETLSFNFIRDTAPIASIVRVPQIMQVNPSLPVRRVTEFIAHAKANPGGIAMGSGGIGSPAHVIGEYFKLMTGTDLTHVPYRGAHPQWPISSPGKSRWPW